MAAIPTSLGLRAIKGGAAVVVAEKRKRQDQLAAVMPVAEGLAVRDALRFACTTCGVEIAELDEKSLPDLAASKLRMSPAAIEARLKTLGATVGKPWRKEQKLACLSAWLAILSTP